MASSNIGNQEIIWKYQTPLDSQYLAKQLTGAVSIGLTSKPRIEISPSNQTAVHIYPPFSLFAASGLTDPTDPLGSATYLFKITCHGDQDLNGDIEPIELICDVNTIGIGFKFDYASTADHYGDFQLLQRDPPQNPADTLHASAVNYPGVILCGLSYDFMGNRIVPGSINLDLFTDFVDSYYTLNGLSTRRRLSAFPLRDLTFGDNKFALKSYGYLDAPFDFAVYAQLEDTTVITQAQTSITLDGVYAGGSKSYQPGDYLLIGYQKTFASSVDVPESLPLEVYWSGSSKPAHGIPARPLSLHVNP